MGINVITISGQSVPRAKARKIGDLYYKKGNLSKKDSGDCYLIEETYYKANSLKIAWDCIAKRYDLISRMVKCVDEEGKMSYCNLDSVNIKELKFTRRGSIVPTIQENLYLGHRTGLYYRTQPNNTPYYDSLDSNLHHTYFLKLEGYNYSDSPYKEQMEIDFNESIMSVSNFSKEVAKYVPFTFGNELECSWGRIPEHKLFQLHLLPVRDGSVNAEYVSTIMSGEKGIQNILNYKDIGYLKADKFCSLHFHFGNIIDTNFENKKSIYNFKKFVVGLYQICYQIQNDVWQICPPYKNNSQFFYEKKGKNHCMSLPNLGIHRLNLNKPSNVEKAFEDIFTLFHEGKPSSEDYNFINRCHFKGDDNKWNFNSRYYNFNFWNLFFNSSRTFEFRAFSGTFNYQKILCYFLICNAIIRYAKEYQNEIFKIKKYDLEDIVSKIYPEDIDEVLQDFILRRRREHLEIVKTYKANNNFDEFKHDNIWTSNKLLKLINQYEQ